MVPSRSGPDALPARVRRDPQQLGSAVFAWMSDLDDGLDASGRSHPRPRVGHFAVASGADVDTPESADLKTG